MLWFQKSQRRPPAQLERRRLTLQSQNENKKRPWLNGMRKTWSRSSLSQNLCTFHSRYIVKHASCAASMHACHATARFPDAIPSFQLALNLLAERRMWPAACRTCLQSRSSLPGHHGQAPSQRRHHQSRSKPPYTSRCRKSAKCLCLRKTGPTA